jgi:hypothetical protein
MRAFDKKKLTRLAWKMLAKNGKMPNDQGVWIPATGSAGAHMTAGHGGGKRR